MAILLVEDEAALANYVVKGLNQHNFKVEHVGRGDLGLAAARRSSYELAIIDRMLPGLDGLSLVKSLRQDSSHTPVLILSNLGGLDDRVEGLNAGADDYLAKPFAFSELLARVNALLRRPAIAQHEPQILKAGELEIDRIKRKVTRGGQPIALQPREFSLLEYLMKRSDQIVTRTMLLEGVWNYHFDPKTHIVETHMSRLRGKIGSDLIQTIRGSGYMIRATKTDA
ncbi:MAG: response regulator transcription factor [Pseudomonadota bacterium]